jgi:hypothetical protein
MYHSTSASPQTRFLVYKVVLGQVFLPVLGFFLSVSFHQLLHTHLYLGYMLLLPAGQTGETWEPSKSTAVSEIGEHCLKKLLFFFLP